MKKILLFLISLTFLSSANAGFYINPGIAISVSGDADGTDVDNNYMLGQVQLGWSTLGLSFGADYEMTLTDVELEATPTNNEFSANNLGVFVGYQFPILFRIYAAYMISGKIEGQNNTLELADMSGTKIGLGFTGLPFVSINLEMRKFTYDEASLGGVVASTSYDGGYDNITLGVSFPFSL